MGAPQNLQDGSPCMGQFQRPAVTLTKWSRPIPAPTLTRVRDREVRVSFRNDALAPNHSGHQTAHTGHRKEGASWR